MLKSVMYVAVMVACGSTAFHLPASTSSHASTAHLSMVGGKGWDNSDYLSGLSGGEEERQKATEDYQEFSARRQEFLNRQEDIMKTPQGRAFLEQQKEQDQQRQNTMPVPDEAILKVQPGSGGGFRMAQMMAQAKKMKEMQDEMKSMGFAQKFAVPLDDDDDQEEDE